MGDTRPLISWAVLLPIIFVSLLLAAMRVTWLSCLIGGITLSALFVRYWSMKRQMGLLHRGDAEVGPVEWLKLMSIAVVAQASTDLHIEMAVNPSHPSLFEALTTLGIYNDVWLLLGLSLVAVVSLMAVQKFQKAEKWAKRFERASRGMATFQFIQNLAILVCGLWGAEALKHAIGTLAFPSTNQLVQESAMGDVGALVLNAMAHQRESALGLYRLQNQFLFYSLFFFIPVGWLLWDSSRWYFRLESPRPSIQGRGWFTCGLLMLSVGGAASTTGVLYRYPTIAILGMFGEPRDKELAYCLRSARESSEEMACISPWEAGWQLEMDGFIANALRSISPASQKQLAKGQASFQRMYVQSVQAPNNDRYEQFNAVFARGTNIRNRVKQLRKRLVADYAATPSSPTLR